MTLLESFNEQFNPITNESEAERIAEYNREKEEEKQIEELIKKITLAEVNEGNAVCRLSERLVIGEFIDVDNKNLESIPLKLPYLKKYLGI